MPLISPLMPVPPHAKTVSAGSVLRGGGLSFKRLSLKLLVSAMHFKGYRLHGVVVYFQCQCVLCVFIPVNRLASFYTAASTLQVFHLDTVTSLMWVEKKLFWQFSLKHY